jgi:large subunit ribosomal protein L14e
MFDVGRVCIKIAGRDAGKKCVIVKHVEGKFYLVDGETRRRKCNNLHLEPTGQVLSISEDASHSEIAKAFKEMGISLSDKKAKAKTEKPKKTRTQKKSAEAAPADKKKAKKAKEDKK